MIRIYLKQAWNLLKQNPLFSTLYITGTGLSIVMTMVIAIVYHVRLAPVYPELNRMRTLVIKSARMTSDGNTHSSNISYSLLKDWLYPLKSAELATGVLENHGAHYVQTVNDGEEIPAMVKFTDENFFRLFPFQWMDGKPFSEADRHSGLRNAVLTDSYAQRLFGTVEGVVGKNVSLDFIDIKIVGIVKGGSFLTPDSYAQIYLPYSCVDGYDNDGVHWALRGYRAYILMKENGSAREVKEEVQELVRKFNASDLAEGWKLDLIEQPEIYWQSTFRAYSNVGIDWIAVIGMFAGIFMILLFVPAFNLSGMISARMERYLPDLGIRKAFGATRRQLLIQIIWENLLLSGLGTLLGLILAWIALYVSGNAIFSLFDTEQEIVKEGVDVGVGADMLFAPSIFIAAVLFCLLLNLISSLIPAWNALRKPIVKSLNEQK